MFGRRAVRATLSVTVVAALAGAGTAAAAPPHPLDDGNGKKWRQLYETSGLSPTAVAQVCPRDGATRCSGSIGTRNLSGWIWATDDQVIELLGRYAPAILTADPPAVSGPDYFGIANGFLAEMRNTGYVSGYGFYSEWTTGWTASTDEAGQPISGRVGFGWWPPGGGFSVASNDVDPFGGRGVFLWRPSTDDLTPPTITPTVTGTLGTNGWYTSDVSVSFTVEDGDTPVSSTTGCDPVTVTSDTVGTTFRCEATSGGGTATSTVVVKRDATAPTVTCPSPPQQFEIYQLGAWVRATVTDATSGPLAPLTQGATNTSTPGTFMSTVTGTDRAGNRTTRTCAYEVVIPTCNGLTPTIVGTAVNNTINGTGGPDVIVGLGGADTINGLGGDDVICGNDGPDRIYGGDGKDWIDGGASPDDLNGGSGDDFLDGGLHNDSLRGDNGRDTCVSGETRRSSCEA
jgi:RTX calcium-binding nonapeptide repeat (4 copies)